MKKANGFPFAFEFSQLRLGRAQQIILAALFRVAATV
jgi:hypothetical protein